MIDFLSHLLRLFKRGIKRRLNIRRHFRCVAYLCRTLFHGACCFFCSFHRRYGIRRIRTCRAGLARIACRLLSSGLIDYLTRCDGFRCHRGRATARSRRGGIADIRAGILLGAHGRFVRVLSDKSNIESSRVRKMVAYFEPLRPRAPPFPRLLIRLVFQHRLHAVLRKSCLPIVSTNPISDRSLQRRVSFFTSTAMKPVMLSASSVFASAKSSN